MITNIACWIIISFCMAAQFFGGAYTHVMKQMAEEYRYILSLTVSQLSAIDTDKELL